jgi:hypothetical protein
MVRASIKGCRRIQRPCDRSHRWRHDQGAGQQRDGLRLGELASLTAPSCDWTTRTLSVAAPTPRTASWLSCPFHSQLAAELQAWAKGKTGELFPGLRQKCVARMIRLDLQRAGVA